MRAALSGPRFRGDARGGNLSSSTNFKLTSSWLSNAKRASLSPRPRRDVTNGTSLHEPLEGFRPPGIDYRDIVLLQAFAWESSVDGDERGHKSWYKRLRQEIPLMQKFHITHVWLPPASQSLDRAGYLPQSLYDLNSSYGTYDELRDLNRDLWANSLRPVADIVMNHRCPDGQDENGAYNRYMDELDHPGAKLEWDSSAIASDDPAWPGVGDRDTGKDYPDAPDIDHTNPVVVSGLTDWLRWMRTHAGFQGFRLDYAFGYAPAVAKAYLTATLETRATVDGASLVGDFSVAECWDGMEYKEDGLQYNQDTHRQHIVDWVDGSGTCTAFDFTLKGVLQEAVSRCEYRRLVDQAGQAPGVNGWWPTRAVTFVENHDTIRHWPFPKHAVEQGYAYILSHPGIPCIFWNHMMADGGEGKISRLMDLRRRAGIRADAKMDVLRCEDSIYVAKVHGTVSDVLVKLGPAFDMGHAAPDGSWEMWSCGKDWALWKSK
jgi:alpha-amylase